MAHELSSRGSRALEHGVNSCVTRAHLLRIMWDLPGSGIEPCLLHWQVDCTTEPPGKPELLLLHYVNKTKLYRASKCLSSYITKYPVDV